MNTKEKYAKAFKMFSQLEIFEDMRSIMEGYAAKHVMHDELKAFGIEIPIHSLNGYQYTAIDDFRHIVTLDGKVRSISFPNDGEQRIGRFLKISFPSGAYIFGNDYPTELFDAFFTELKTLNPDCVDSHNKALYFELEKAGNAFNSFEVIYSKYKELNKIDVLHRNVKKAQLELEKAAANVNKHQKDYANGT